MLKRLPKYHDTWRDLLTFAEYVDLLRIRRRIDKLRAEIKKLRRPQLAIVRRAYTRRQRNGNMEKPWIEFLTGFELKEYTKYEEEIAEAYRSIRVLTDGFKRYKARGCNKIRQLRKKKIPRRGTGGKARPGSAKGV